MDPILTVLLRLFRQKSKFKSVGGSPPGSSTYDHQPKKQDSGGWIDQEPLI